MGAVIDKNRPLSYSHKELGRGKIEYDRQGAYNEIVSVIGRSYNPTELYAAIFEILCLHGYDVNIEDIAQMGLCSWPSEEDLRKSKGKIY